MSNIKLISKSVQHCIDELSALLELLASSDGPQEHATRNAYRRLIRQLTMRQFELEERMQRLRSENPTISEETTDEIEAAWSQLEKSAQVISKSIEAQGGTIRSSDD